MIKVSNDLLKETNSSIYKEIKDTYNTLGNITFFGKNNSRVIGPSNSGLIISAVLIVIPSILFFIFV